MKVYLSESFAPEVCRERVEGKWGVVLVFGAFNIGMTRNEARSFAEDLLAMVKRLDEADAYDRRKADE